MAEVTRKGDRIEIGDKVRIEAGPPRRRRRATAESLANDVTAEHYQIGMPDALGKPIVEGEMFDYLDWLGDYVFYLFFKRDIAPDDPKYAPGEIDASAAALDEGSENVTRYTYVFDEVGVFGTEDEAIDEGQKLAGGGAAKKGN